MSVQMLSLALFVDNSDCVSVWHSNGMKLDQVLSHTLLTTFSFKHLHVRYCNLLICPSNPGPLTTGYMTYSQPSLRASTYSTLFARTHTHTHTHTLWTPNYRADVQAEGDCRPVVPAMIRAFPAASLLSQAPGASAEGQGLLPNSASLSMHDTSTHASKVLAALSLWVKLAYNTLKLWLSYIKMHLN